MFLTYFTYLQDKHCKRRLEHGIQLYIKYNYGKNRQSLKMHGDRGGKQTLNA